MCLMSWHSNLMGFFSKKKGASIMWRQQRKVRTLFPPLLQNFEGAVFRIIQIRDLYPKYIRNLKWWIPTTKKLQLKKKKYQPKKISIKKMGYPGMIVHASNPSSWLGWLRQEDCKFEANLSHLVKPLET